MANGAVTRSFRSLTTILQGCAVSCMILNGLGTVWADEVESVAKVRARGLVDDWFVYASERTLGEGSDAEDSGGAEGTPRQADGGDATIEASVGEHGQEPYQVDAQTPGTPTPEAEQRGEVAEQTSLRLPEGEEEHEPARRIEEWEGTGSPLLQRRSSRRKPVARLSGTKKQRRRNVCEALRKAADVTSKFLSKLAIKACPKMSYTFATVRPLRKAAHRRVKLQGHKLPKPKLAARMLGAHVTFCKRRQRGVHHQRAQAATEKGDRIL